MDLSVQSMLTPLNTYVSPYFWGIGEFEVHRAALENRSFTPSRGNSSSRTGLTPRFQETPFSSLDPSTGPGGGGKPLTVFVGMRRLNLNKENVTTLESLKGMSEVNTRFVAAADPEEVSDIHQGGPSARVSRLYHVLRIFWETEKEQLGDYDLIPVAMLERFGEEIRLSSRFVPPSIGIFASDTLTRIVKEIRDQITARSHQLEEYKTQRGIHTAEFGAGTWSISSPLGH